MRNKIIVVEGKHDLDKIKKIYPNLDVLITNGSEVSDNFLIMLKTLANNNDIILFLDPDGPGERIRRLISNEIPNVKHAFIEKYKAKTSKKIGVEHASISDIIESLDDIKCDKNYDNMFTNIELLNLGLIGNYDSVKLREKLLDSLNLGYVNGKGINKRLGLSDKSKDEIIKLINEIRCSNEQSFKG